MNVTIKDILFIDPPKPEPISGFGPLMPADYPVRDFFWYDDGFIKVSDPQVSIEGNIIYRVDKRFTSPFDFLTEQHLFDISFQRWLSSINDHYQFSLRHRLSKAGSIPRAIALRSIDPIDISSAFYIYHYAAKKGYPQIPVVLIVDDKVAEEISLAYLVHEASRWDRSELLEWGIRSFVENSFPHNTGISNELSEYLTDRDLGKHFDYTTWKFVETLFNPPVARSFNFIVSVLPFLSGVIYSSPIAHGSEMIFSDFNKGLFVMPPPGTVDRSQGDAATASDYLKVIQQAKKHPKKVLIRRIEEARDKVVYPADFNPRKLRALLKRLARNTDIEIQGKSVREEVTELILRDMKRSFTSVAEIEKALGEIKGRIRGIETKP